MRSYVEHLQALLPAGDLWPRGARARLTALLSGLAGEFSRIDARAGDLRREAVVRFSAELLADFERVLGPDPCGRDRPDLSLDERRQLALQRWTAGGGQSRAFFIRVAAMLGYEITIREFRPFVAGVSRAGDGSTQVGSAVMRFFWLVRLTAVESIWFRAGSGRAGLDPHVRFPRSAELECMLNRLKPAHTTLVFRYAVGRVILTTEDRFFINTGDGSILAAEWD